MEGKDQGFRARLKVRVIWRPRRKVKTRVRAGARLKVKERAWEGVIVRAVALLISRESSRSW